VAAGEDVMELWRLAASRLGALYASGEATPVDVFEALDSRIERVDRELNALIARAPDAHTAALESAARWRAGVPRGPLDGVPIAVKDNILARGMPTTWGSRAFADAITADDERPVARLREAGAIIVGKTNCPEFTLEGYTDNALFGVTRNPWDLRLTPGGSSGGAVAGVAAGLFPLALGTDGGGSTRRPASHTGLVGFKPSIGAIARYPSLPQILLDFEVIGPIARTVADTVLLYNAIAGPDPRDRLSLAARAAPVMLDAPPPLRIRLVMRFDDNALDPEIESSVAAAADTLRALGHRVETGSLPFDLGPITRFWPLLGQVGLAQLFERMPEAARLAQPKFVEMAEAGRAVPAARYFDGIEAVRLFRHDVTNAFAEFDLIMTPSAAALPWPAEQSHPPTIAGQPVGPRGHAVYTGWVNACGHPAISLPSTPSRAGLPIGFQLVGRYGDDELLLQIAAQYEAAAPFAQRWPALAEQR
jgi:aspartyl-tRNA(Asn)/glutamyl-tRNA(Gln) amidotransferase subunit A